MVTVKLLEVAKEQHEGVKELNKMIIRIFYFNIFGWNLNWKFYIDKLEWLLKPSIKQVQADKNLI